MTETATLPISAQIRAAMAVIADKEHWTQGSFGLRRDKESPYGVQTFRDAKDLQTLAVQFCAVGAFAKVLNVDGSDAHDSEPVKWVNKWVRTQSPYFSLAQYNNDHSHRDVMALLESAAIARKAEEAAEAVTN